VTFAFVVKTSVHILLPSVHFLQVLLN